MKTLILLLILSNTFGSKTDKQTQKNSYSTVYLLYNNAWIYKMRGSLSKIDNDIVNIDNDRVNYYAKSLYCYDEIETFISKLNIQDQQIIKEEMQLFEPIEIKLRQWLQDEQEAEKYKVTNFNLPAPKGYNHTKYTETETETQTASTQTEFNPPQESLKKIKEAMHYHTLAERRAFDHMHSDQYAVSEPKVLIDGVEISINDCYNKAIDLYIEAGFNIQNIHYKSLAFNKAEKLQLITKYNIFGTEENSQIKLNNAEELQQKTKKNLETKMLGKSFFQPIPDTMESLFFSTSQNQNDDF